MNICNSRIYRKFPAIVFVCFVLSGCETIPQQAHVYPEVQLRPLCLKHNIDWQWDSIAQVVTLTKDRVSARALVGSDVVIVDGQHVFLSGPIGRSRNAIVVPSDFEHKVLSRFKSTASVPRRVLAIQKIMIDAGHGGKDPGAVGYTGIHEKDIVLDISKKIRRILEKNGYKVVMTRESDKFLSLEERTELATREKVDMFVSIHANSIKSRRVQGFEIYFPRSERNEENSLEQLRKNEKLLYRQMSMSKNSPQLEDILSDMLAIHKEKESKPLASSVAKETIQSTAVRDRGSKNAGFFVIRNTLVPAVLVEVGYLSNPREERLLNTPSHRQELAEGIAKGIMSYVKDE